MERISENEEHQFENQFNTRGGPPPSSSNHHSNIMQNDSTTHPPAITLSPLPPPPPPIRRRNINDQVRRTFSDFCDSTSLHGWHHLNRANPKYGRTVWFLIVFSSLAVAAIFLTTAIRDFADRSVVTTIETTTASLQSVYFPTVIVCNINQIKKSSFRSLGINNTEGQLDLLYHQFYTGMDRNLTAHEEEIIKNIATSEYMVKRLMRHWTMFSLWNSTDVDSQVEAEDWHSFLANNSDYILTFDYVRDISVGEPGDSPVMFAKYGDLRPAPNATSFLPFFGTDIGLCSLIKPQINFNESLNHQPFSKRMYGPSEGVSNARQIQPGSKVGKTNGLTLMLDAEIYDYLYHGHSSEGFKIAVQHHLDQPLMAINELDVAPGLESQVAVTPVIYDVTEEARQRFSPDERGCYFEDEVTLKYLPKNLYRYDINNCLFEAAYEKVLEFCQCTPYFHWAGLSEWGEFCKGQKLLCLNRVLSRIGEFNDIEGPEGQRLKCLAPCTNQQNQVTITSSRLPNAETFVDRPEFCLLLNKLLKVCKSKWKRKELDFYYPKLCPYILDAEKTYEYAEDFCERLAKDNDNFHVNVNSSAFKVRGVLFEYARQNLATINVYIQQPVVTKIVKDERIPVIWFVANCGGILGLCMGFSIVTVFEVLHGFVEIFLDLFSIVASFIRRVFGKNKKHSQETHYCHSNDHQQNEFSLEVQLPEEQEEFARNKRKKQQQKTSTTKTNREMQLIQEEDEKLQESFPFVPTMRQEEDTQEFTSIEYIDNNSFSSEAPPKYSTTSQQCEHSSQHSVGASAYVSSKEKASTPSASVTSAATMTSSPGHRRKKAKKQQQHQNGDPKNGNSRHGHTSVIVNHKFIGSGSNVSGSSAAVAVECNGVKSRTVKL